MLREDYFAAWFFICNPLQCEIGIVEFMEL